jgi:hypothetical protein
MSHQQLQYGGHIFTCDGCPLGNEEFDKLDFREAVNILNKNGWAIRRTGQGFEHYCKDCVTTGVLRAKIHAEEKAKYASRSAKGRTV